MGRAASACVLLAVAALVVAAFRASSCHFEPGGALASAREDPSLLVVALVVAGRG